MFRNRAEAGRRLAERLLHLKNAYPVVLALPRGGVPVAWPIAEALSAPLDLLLVRKIGAPEQPELALGAVVEGEPPQIVVNDEIVRLLTTPFVDAVEKLAIERNIDAKLTFSDVAGPFTLTRQGVGLVQGIEVTSRTDPRGGEYHWLNFHRGPRANPPDAESVLVGAGRITVTPLRSEILWAGG